MKGSRSRAIQIRRRPGSARKAWLDMDVACSQEGTTGGPIGDVQESMDIWATNLFQEVMVTLESSL